MIRARVAKAQRAIERVQGHARTQAEAELRRLMSEVTVAPRVGERPTVAQVDERYRRHVEALGRKTSTIAAVESAQRVCGSPRSSEIATSPACALRTSRTSCARCERPAWGRSRSATTWASCRRCSETAFGASSSTTIAIQRCLEPKYSPFFAGAVLLRCYLGAAAGTLPSAVGALRLSACAFR
jgi:hypothetical protein